MLISIEVPDKDTKRISSAGLETLRKITQNNAKEIIKKAKHIEQSNRENGAKQEITSSMIIMATGRLTHLPNFSRYKTFWHITSVLSASLATYMSGFLTQPNKLYQLVFIFLIAISCISIVLSLMKDTSK